MLDTKLLTFITVGNTNNLSKAAQLLNITQPAVSQHMKALEEYYEVNLLSRVGKQIKLTEEGKLLFKYASELARLSKIMKIELKNSTSILKKYNVGATLTIGGYILPKIIGEYRKKKNNIEIILNVENTESILKKLFNGTISLAIIEGPFDKNKVEEYGYSLNDMNVYMEIGNINALISLVESNLGYTIISKEAIKSSVHSRTLKIIPIENFKILREFNFVYMDNFYDKFINEFITFCNQYNQL